MAGDSLLVGFGVPFEQADASDRAIACALAMHAAFSRASTNWPSRFGVEGGLGIGINYGEVIAGNVGSPNYMSYTIIGDAVNVAARLTARAGDGEIYLSERLLAMASDIEGRFDVVRLEPIRLKGKSELQQAYKLVACEATVTAWQQAAS